MKTSTPTPPLQKGQIVDLKIESLAYGGNGLGRVEGYVVFVPGAVPGDRVKARITRRQTNHAEGELTELIAPSDLRIAAPCPIFDVCGGCTWQHLPYEKQLAFKEQQVRETLAHLGGLPEAAIQPILPSPELWRYRNKMDYTVGANEQGEVIVGFHRPGSFSSIVDVEECLIQPESFDAALGVFRSHARRHKLSAYDPRTHKGFLRHLIVRQSKASGDMLAVLITERGELPDTEGLLDALRKTCPGLRGFLWGINTALADVARMEEERFQWGDLFFYETLGEVRYRISAFSFFQTNSLGAKQLYDVIRRYLEGGPKESLLDAYCGIGAIGLYCADTVGKVYGIDNVVSSIWDARENASLNGLSNCTFFSGDIRERLPLMLSAAAGPVTRVVVDPPRGGMDKKVLRHLLDLGAPVLVYVSCNPATMARDVVAISEAGYHLEAIQPVDMFPHTYHIETVIRCVKE